jgi:hypothetical protein
VVKLLTSNSRKSRFQTIPVRDEWKFGMSNSDPTVEELKGLQG